MAAKLRAAGLMAMPASTKKKKKRQAPRDNGFIHPDQVYQSMYAQLDSERKVCCLPAWQMTTSVQPAHCR